MQAICGLTRLALILAIGCAMVACGGGDSGSTPTSGGQTKSGSGTSSTPPAILLFAILGAEDQINAVASQGQGYDTVTLNVLAQQGGPACRW
jgi:hypothetical protein